MRALLDHNGLDRRPHNVAPNCWYYEDAGGLHIYWEALGESAILAGIIPWRSLRASLNRYEKSKLKRKK